MPISELAYQTARISAWAFPVLLSCIGVFALIRGHHWAGSTFICAGIVALVWDFLFLPASILPGQPRALIPMVVLYEDAPLGFFLSHLLPPVGGLFLLAGTALLVLRPSS